VRANEDYVARETLATMLSYDGTSGGETTAIEGKSLTIAVSRAA
jgi:hypothetical protein